MRKASEKVKV